jgi:hypothetical protein
MRRTTLAVMVAALRPRSGTTLARAFLLDSVAEHDAIMGATRSAVIVATLYFRPRHPPHKDVLRTWFRVVQRRIAHPTKLISFARAAVGG